MGYWVNEARKKNARDTARHLSETGQALRDPRVNEANQYKKAQRKAAKARRIGEDLDCLRYDRQAQALHEVSTPTYQSPCIAGGTGERFPPKPGRVRYFRPGMVVGFMPQPGDMTKYVPPKCPGSEGLGFFDDLPYRNLPGLNGIVKASGPAPPSTWQDRGRVLRDMLPPDCHQTPPNKQGDH